MRDVLEPTEGLGLLISLSWDRMMTGGALVVALGVAGWLASAGLG